MIALGLAIDGICSYGCVDKIVDDRGELDAKEAREFFSKMGINLSLTMAYNPEANEKVERGHGPIMKALVHACHGKNLRMAAFVAVCAMG
jgi:hypothetical protein